jgi:hypothetical protein
MQVDGESLPYEYAYSQWMTGYVQMLTEGGKYVPSFDKPVW